MVMAFDGRWKYIHSEGLRPILFDLETDPQEITDLGDHRDVEDIRKTMQKPVLDRASGGKMRVTQTNAFFEAKQRDYKKGVLIGFWDEAELDAALAKV